MGEMQAGSRKNQKRRSLKVLGVYYGNPEDNTKRIAELNALRTKLLPYTVGDYIGNPDGDLNDYLEVYFGANAERLRSIKRKYDPSNLFRFEQSITP